MSMLSFVCVTPRTLTGQVNVPEKCIVMDVFVEHSSYFIQVKTTQFRGCCCQGMHGLAHTRIPAISGFKAELNEVMTLTMTPNFVFNIYFMCMSASPVCMLVYHVRV